MSYGPIPIRPTTASLAERAYKAYADSTENKNFKGDPMPEWADLPQPIRNAWGAAAESVRHDVLVQLGQGI